MSRRKQAKPRSLKPEFSRNPTNLIVKRISTFDDTAQISSSDEIVNTETGGPDVIGLFARDDAPPPAQGATEANNDSETDTLGSIHDSCIGSETQDENQTSPSHSSCGTPNSLVDIPDSELSFTVGVTEATPYACQFCDKAFARLSFLKKHEQIHSDQMPFQCDFCSRLFKHKRSRDRHIKLHTGDKKYKCTYCDTAFSRSDHLKIHMKTHDNQKPHQCTICNRGYNTAAALTSHMQNHKRQKRDMPLLSPIASTNARGSEIPTTEDYAKIHCIQCGKEFYRQLDLQTHFLTDHTDELFKSNGNSESPAPPQSTKFSCMYCSNDNFTTLEQLQMHIQISHSPTLNDEVRDLSTVYQIQNNKITSPDLISLTPRSSMSTINNNNNNNNNSTSGSESALLYYCDLCTMNFSSMGQLQTHYANVHKDIIVQGDAEQTEPMISSLALAEHFFINHVDSNLRNEQLKPTDLSKKSMRPTSSKRKRSSTITTNTRQTQIDRPTPASTPAPTQTPTSNSTLALLPTSTSRHEYPRMFLCNQCDAAFPDFESFRTHLRSHIGGAYAVKTNSVGNTAVNDFKSENSQYQPNICICPHCGLICKDIVVLEQHILYHFVTTSLEYGCQSCLKMFPKPESLQRHLLDNHTHHVFRCLLCKEMFETKTAIQLHFTVSHSTECKFYRCTACPNTMAVFATEIEFSLHVRSVHGLDSLLATLQPKKSLCCIFCQKTFTTELDMHFHMTSHSKQFRCPICSEAFHVEFLLDRHIQAYHVVATDENSGNGGDLDNTNRKSLSNSPITVPSIRKLKTPPNRILQKNVTNENNNMKRQLDSSDPNNCDICERNDFTNETELIAHRKLAHHVRNSSKNGIVSLHCAYCNENCKTRTELENHMKSHSQSTGVAGKHKCNICDELCPSAVLLAEHKLTHCKVIAGKCCTQCKTSLTNEEQFYCHLVQHSNNNNGNGNQKKLQVVLPTPCVICRQTLISDVEVRIHSQFHLRNKTLQHSEYQCYMCCKLIDAQSAFVSKGGCMCFDCFSLLQQHQLQQIQLQQPSSQRQQDATHYCSQCQLTFESSPALEQHVKSSHIKLYVCMKCQTSFETENDIQIHLATAHLMTDSNKHECHLCRRLYSSPTKLQAHLIEHTFAGCDNFTCYVCSSVFTGAQGLQAHIAEHRLAELPYDCTECSLKFFFRAELDNHSYSHFGQGSNSQSSNNSEVTPMLNPKTYCISTNGKATDLSKHLPCTSVNMEVEKTIKEPPYKKRKCHKLPDYLKCPKCNQEFPDSSELQMHLDNCLESQPIVKKEPNNEIADFKKEDYIEVSSPVTNKNCLNNESNPAESNDTTSTDGKKNDH